MCSHWSDWLSRHTVTATLFIPVQLLEDYIIYIESLHVIGGRAHHLPVTDSCLMFGTDSAWRRRDEEYTYLSLRHYINDIDTCLICLEMTCLISLEKNDSSLMFWIDSAWRRRDMKSILIHAWCSGLILRGEEEIWRALEKMADRYPRACLPLCVFGQI